MLECFERFSDVLSFTVSAAKTTEIVIKTEITVKILNRILNTFVDVGEREKLMEEMSQGNVGYRGVAMIQIYGCDGKWN